MTQGAAEDLWHLSIDDLFVAPVETPPLEGPGPFVINLSASTAPITVPPAGLAGFEKHKLFQWSRKEDGRDRFRLRLGFFDTPAAANEALAVLRDRYPSAYATNVADEDQRFNPARVRPVDNAGAAAAPLPKATPTAPHARGVVRTDNSRRGHKKRDVRRDHGTQQRGGEGHGPQRNKHSGRHGHQGSQGSQGSQRSAHALEVKKAVEPESLDVESILLAALAPSTPAVSSKAPTPPSKPAQPQASKPGHPHKAAHPHKHGGGHKHQRHSKHEAKHAPAPSAHKASVPAVNKSQPASPPPAKPAPVSAAQPVSTAPAVSSPQPVSAAQPVSTPQPVSTAQPISTLPQVSTVPTVSAAQSVSVSIPPSPQARESSVAPPTVAMPTITYSVALEPARKRAPEVQTAAAVKPAAPIAPAAMPAAKAPDDDAHAVTHPRIDEVPDTDSAATDIPIDLHFIDRIFEDDKPAQDDKSADDDTPTVEVLALQSPEVAPEPQTPATVPAKAEASAELPVEAPKERLVESAKERFVEAPREQVPDAFTQKLEALKEKLEAPKERVEAPKAKVEAPKERLVDAAWEKFKNPQAQVDASEPDDDVEMETPAMSPQDIIALLTQPVPVYRPKESKADAPKRESAPPSAPLSVEPVASAPAPEVKPPAPPVVEAKRELPAPPVVEAKRELPVAPPAEAKREAAVAPAVEAKQESSVPPSPAAAPQAKVATAEPDSSVGAISARIESDLEAIMQPATRKSAPERDRTPSAPPAAPPAAEPAPAQPMIELELAADPAPVPVLVDIIEETIVEEVIVEEVIVAQVLAPRVEPVAPKAAAPVPMVPPPVAAAAPSRTAPVDRPVAKAPANAAARNSTESTDSIFKVKSRPAEAPKPAAPAAPEVKRPVVVFDTPVEDVDSTQTLRALTPLELTDDNQSKWFAVQLVLSEEPTKIESLPHIDIFDEYRLYSISGIDQAKFMHSLRMGFFSAESSAEAVAGYLRTFFDGAVVKRVSIAEHERFSERRAKASKPEAEPAPKGTAARPEAATKPTGNGSAESSSKAPVRNKRSTDSSPTGRHKSLGEQLYDEARQVVLSQSAIRRLPKNASLWSKLFGQKG